MTTMNVGLLVLLLVAVTKEASGQIGESFPCGVQDPDVSQFPRANLFRGHDRRGLQRSVSSLGLTKVLVVRGVMSDQSTEGLMSASELMTLLNTVGDFFNSNSGGRQTYEFTIYDQGTPAGFAQLPGYSSSTCERGSSQCPEPVHLSSEIENNPAFSEYTRFLYIYEHGCRCFGWKGLGQVPGFVTWCNGRPDLRVLGHEFGHNNGAFHSNRGEREYGNDFSIMGGSGYNMHFTTAGKLSMQWLDETKHVKTVARSGGCFDFNPCIQTCTQRNPCNFDLFAHDQGSYADDRVYTVRVLTNQFKDENIWIEYRKNYPQDYAASEDGVLLVWSIKRNSIIYGPTHLEDYDSITPSQADSFLPIGMKWVYDYDNIGAVIEATQKGTDSMKVSVYFTDRIASTSDAKQEALLKGRNDTELGCGTSKRTIKLARGDQSKVFQTMIQAETTVSITMSKIDCSTGQPPEDAGLYVYPTYPLQLELNTNPDMANGAIYFLKFECQPANSPKEFINGDVSVRSLGTPSARAGYNYLDFSQANYFVLHKGAMPTALDVEISLAESSSCYSACEGIEVSSSSSVALGVIGQYVKSSTTKHPETGVDLPVFTRRGGSQQKLVFDTGREAWTLVTNGRIFAEQQDKSIQTEYPHVITSWSSGIKTSCFSRGAVVGTEGGSGGAINGEMDLAGMIIFGAVVASVALSILAVPFYLVRVKRTRAASKQSARYDTDDFEAPFPGPTAAPYSTQPRAVVIPAETNERHQESFEDETEAAVEKPRKFRIFGPQREKKMQIPFSYKRKSGPVLPQPSQNNGLQVAFTSPTQLYRSPQKPPENNYESDDTEEDLQEARRQRRASSIERYEAFMRQYDSQAAWQQQNTNVQMEDHYDLDEDDETRGNWFHRTAPVVQNSHYAPRPSNHPQRGAGYRSTYVPAWERRDEQVAASRPRQVEENSVRPIQRGKCTINGCANWSFDEGYCRFHLKTSGEV